MMNKIMLSLMLVVGAVTLVGCGTTAKPTPAEIENPNAQEKMEEKVGDNGTITDIVVATDGVSILKDIVVSLDLTDMLSSNGPYTVFAPTNEAFEALLEELDVTLEELSEDRETLKTIVQYHVLEGKVTADDVMSMEDGSMVRTVGGQSFKLTNKNSVMINDAKVISTDIMASNGIVHLLDAVLIPPTVAEAIAKNELPTIVDTAMASDDFPTLVAAVKAAGLVETLNSEGPFTVFAPTEEAFAQLLVDLEVTAEELLDNTELLTSVLTYHVLPDVYMASDVVSMDGAADFKTVQGLSISIDPNNGEPMINDSNIVTVDIEASNGVIHVIDKVLLPTQ